MFKRVWFTPIVVFAALQSAQAQAQACGTATGLPCVYSVKFICGDQAHLPNLRPPSEPPVKPGNYATAINIHNFHLDQVAFIEKSAVIALPESQQPRPISSTSTLELPPGLAFEIDCSDIVSLFLPSTAPLPPFIKGFVVLRGLPAGGPFPPLPTLSVTAVYTAQATTPIPPPSGPVSIEVVPVQPFAGP
jgi:hypothetical protein